MSGKRHLFDRQKAYRKPVIPSQPEGPPPERPADGRPYAEIQGDGLVASRLTLISRQGAQFSYPYAYIGLLQMKHPSLITIHCTCSTVDTISIQGWNLGELARLFDLQRLTTVWESPLDNPQQADMVVETIGIQLPKEDTGP
ncbi:hypothetical protein [Cerasicoccus fimbriatus]|uniref:hypothetical protein n=1 Tax=Cerasicoccus fimbriatus TaxID=3014554 RepID=UPI0022B49972|nr:hypothetical protein [Cerasicoccus sp. TK19100]